MKLKDQQKDIPFEDTNIGKIHLKLKALLAITAMKRMVKKSKNSKEESKADLITKVLMANPKPEK